MPDKKDDNSSTQIITSASILKELDNFLNFAYYYNGNERWHSAGRKPTSVGTTITNFCDRAETAMFLLKNLPSARPAALMYLAEILTKQVTEYVKKCGTETKSDAGNYETNQISTDLEDMLEKMLETVPEVWGPLIANWAVENLSRWSLEWGARLMPRRDAMLEEHVASWLDCIPARTLANLTVICVAHNPDATVAALMEASSCSGSALDWLVAHVGCSFPAAVISRVVLLGLRGAASNTLQNYSSHHLSSINVILDHLAERNLPEIQRVLHGILLRTFSGSSDAEIQAAIPFLLQLAASNTNRTVLTALTNSLDDILSPQHLSLLANQVPWWVPKYFSSLTAMLDIVVHLLLDTGGIAASALLRLLLQGTTPSSSLPLSVSKAMGVILHKVVWELCRESYMRRSSGSGPANIPLLAGLSGIGQYGPLENASNKRGTKDIYIPVCQLIDWVLEGQESGKCKSDIVVRRLGQILILLVAQQGPSSGAKVLIYMLQRQSSQVSSTLYLLASLITALVGHHSYQNSLYSLPAAVMTCLQNPIDYSSLCGTLQSLDALLLASSSQNSHSHAALIATLQYNLPKLSQLINLKNIGSYIMKLLTYLPLDMPMSFNYLQSLIQAAVFYFFITLREGSLSEKLSAVSKCSQILGSLAHSHIGHRLLIRLLVESAFRPEWADLFGASEHASLETKELPNELLININKQFDSWVKLPQSHTSIFHDGIIGRGLRAKLNKNKMLTTTEITMNSQFLLNMLVTICKSHLWTQGAATIGLLLVELISPDIMFNGFPWPEENIKFTFERDLAIKKTFEDYPIAWNLLKLIASCRPALCYCSVLVRALTAAYASHWSTSTLNQASQSPNALNASYQLLSIMVMGQFLPDPLSVLPEMLSHLEPYEIAYVLQDVWTYQRDHTPSPDRWMLLPSGHYFRANDCPEPRYLERCHRVIQSHIEVLGHLLPGIQTH